MHLVTLLDLKHKIKKCQVTNLSGRKQMKDKKVIAVVGGDLRAYYLADSLMEHGYKVHTIGVSGYPDEDLCEVIKSVSYVICPIPFTQEKEFIDKLQKEQVLFGGNIPKEIKEHCNKKEIIWFDFLEDEEIASLNAIATAEGTIAAAVNESTGNLHGGKALVLGYGRCATVLAQKLQGLDAAVTVAARKKSALTKAYINGQKGIMLQELPNVIGEFDYIFNTIPALVLTGELLSHTKQDVTIIDIASAPGGTDFERAKELFRNAKLCLGIPGKTAAKVSGRILGQAIINYGTERRRQSEFKG